MDADKRREIMERKTYIDAGGREVRAFTQAFGKNKEPDFYHGVAVMRFRVRHPNGQDVMQERVVEFPFPEETTGVKKAFEVFDAVAQAHMDKMMESERQKAAANKVVGVGAGALTLLGPNGKKIR